MTEVDIGERVARVARGSYGRLMAFLGARTHDLAAAEDALAEAFRAALEQWPLDGVPERPEAWLLTAARRRLHDRARRGAVQAAASESLRYLAELDARDREGAEGEGAIPDERLALLFVCAHPAIDEAVRTPLMLQMVLGLDAARIGSAFLVAPATMGQRLVRAKAKIRDARIPFVVPPVSEWPERQGAVLEAIYAAYGTGWDELGADSRRADLSSEAIVLGRLACVLLPDAPEVRALLALMLFCESRRDARRVDGRYVPLDRQDVARWDRALIDEALEHMEHASRRVSLGRFQCEALIQMVHARRVLGEAVRWDALADIYAALVMVCPTIGAHVGHAAALGKAYGAERGLAALERLPADAVSSYQPYFATRAALLDEAGRNDEARVARERAIGLTEDPALRAWLGA